MENSDKFLSYAQISPQGRPKVGVIDPISTFFWEKQPYFFIIVTYNDQKPTVSMCRCASQYI